MKKEAAIVNILPLVSVGLPVYNGASLLRESLNSLLAQDYPNFELIISDNASEDETEAICREYEDKDQRIRYYRSEQNQGAPWNFNNAFKLSRGKYFMWAAFDDLRAPSYISRCVEVLEAQPETVLCCTSVEFIDEEGHPIEENATLNNDKPTGDTRLERMRKLAAVSCWYDIYGLIRSDALVKTHLFQEVWGVDVVLTLELCLLGNVIAVPDKLFLYRIFNQKTVTQMAAGLEASGGTRKVPPSYTRFTLAMIQAINQSNLPLAEKFVLRLNFLRVFLIQNRQIRNLVVLDLRKQIKSAWKNKKINDLTYTLSMAIMIFPLRKIEHLRDKAQVRRHCACV